MIKICLQNLIFYIQTVQDIYCIYDINSIILKLKELLKEKQFLYIARDKTNKIVTATWVIKATSTVWHTQYIVKDYNANKNGLVEGLLTNCAEYAKNNGADILSFGISTENRGKYLNLGLISFKEHLGVNYQNRYLLEVK